MLGASPSDTVRDGRAYSVLWRDLVGADFGVASISRTRVDCALVFLRFFCGTTKYGVVFFIATAVGLYISVSMNAAFRVRG